MHCMTDKHPIELTKCKNENFLLGDIKDERFNT